IDLSGADDDFVAALGKFGRDLDMALRPDWDEPGASWAGTSDAEKLYNFDPIGGWTASQKQKLLGIQACIWSEPMTDRAVF
ncbi:family 20 glycosylhydrolase, partial [Rhizobium johnstonii]|uniref:family 20 glycosylhydrolase n=1 Tax=Rhizobium johnstonii TaxID=3019933 RepID=UPI003F96C4CF